MRTFPKSFATFRKILDERGEQLRKLTQEELKKRAAKPPEQLIFDLRPATIGIIVQSKPDGNLRVVIQGFVKARFVPGKHVALVALHRKLLGPGFLELIIRWFEVQNLGRFTHSAPMSLSYWECGFYGRPP
jgi:5-formyltetrahydrofolate cyclo-ligase